jgi:ribosomal protein S27E
MTTIDIYIRAFAAPVGWHGPIQDSETARARIETLFAAKCASDLEPIFDWFATIGNRRDYLSYEAHAGGAWKPEPRDRGIFRKAAFTIEHRDRMKGRGLVALDAMRACALAGWAVTAEFFDEARAAELVTPIVTQAFTLHTSWRDFSEQLLMGLEFASGTVEPGLRAAIQSLDGPTWPTPDALPKPARSTRHKGKKQPSPPSLPSLPVTLAMRLSVDCPGCELALSFDGIAEHASCVHCGYEVTLSPKDWAYFFEDDAMNRRAGEGEDDPITNDFGDRFFSRRFTSKVRAPACPCGTTIDPISLAPGRVTCGCGRSSLVHAAGAHAKAVDPGARFVITPLPRPIDPSATFACAACDATQLLGDNPSRVRTCNTCKAPTFVDDIAHQRSFDPPRRRTFYLVLSG